MHTVGILIFIKTLFRSDILCCLQIANENENVNGGLLIIRPPVQSNWRSYKMRSGDWTAAWHIGRSAALPANHRCAVGLLPLPWEEFRQLKLILHSELRRRAASRRALPCPSSFSCSFNVMISFYTRSYGNQQHQGPTSNGTVRPSIVL